MPGVLKGVRYDDPVTIYRGEKVLKIASKLGNESGFADLDLSIDIFYSLYLPFPVTIPLNEVPAGKERNYFIIKEFIDLPDFNSLKLYTIADSQLSTLVSASLIHHIGSELKNELSASGGGGEGGEESVDRATVSRAVKRAVDKVKEESRTLKNIQKVLAEGTQPGTGTVFDIEESGEDVIKLARNADIRKLLDVMSIIPRLTHRIRRRVERSSKGELTGYELGSDLERIVPTELKLPKTYFRVKYIENRLLLYEKVLPKTLGPFYLLIDKCLDGETSIRLRGGGDVKIKDVQVGDEVLSVELKSLTNSTLSTEGAELAVGKLKPVLKWSRVVRVVKGGSRPVYRLETPLNYVRATGNHVIPIFRGGVLAEVPLSEVREGDVVLTLPLRPGRGLGMGNAQCVEGFVLAPIVRKVFDGVSETYDITLENYNRFVANGFVVHNSGSMEGEKIRWAKATAIALFLRARREGRDFFLRFFNGLPHPLIKIPRRMKPSDAISLLKYLSRVKGGGGTDITRAIVTACDDISSGVTRGSSDIVVVTDGEDRISESIVERKLRAANARLVSVMIIGENKDLRRLSHKYFRALKLSSDEILRVAEA